MPREVLDAPELAQTIDLTRPVALPAVAVMHFVADEDDPGLVQVTDWPAPTGTAPLPMTTYGALGRVP
ncbi:SAM-dependent methyltransferase [Spirillospora sp. NPDC047418]